MSTESFIKILYPESSFGRFTDVDGTISFYTRINALVNNDMDVLDVGCGRGSFSEETNEHRKNLQNMRGKARLFVGIDVDMRASENSEIDVFLKIDGEMRAVELVGSC